MEETWIDYDLPPELIAQEPPQNRVDARLMLIDRGRESIEHYHIRDLPELLKAGDRLVFNDTKVIPAQLRGVRIETGGRWQGLFLGETDTGEWRLVCKTRGKLKEPEPVMLLDRDNRETAKLWLLQRGGDGEWLARPEEEAATSELLARVGRVPLPPYIRGGAMVDEDMLRYQTVFARRPGAVAAPTAGLHFTKDLLKALEHNGVLASAVTLHVGMGTFKPISTDDPAKHEMHAEWGELGATAAQEIQQTREEGGRVISVGTTSTRVLESVAAAQEISEDKAIAAWQGETNLFIRPPYEYKLVDALLTNFHFPRTTLLLLVQAFGGSALIREAYQRAVAEKYRFYSYGDAMLIV